MKKLISMILVIAMIATFSAVAFAAGEVTNASITITGVGEGASYSIYQPPVLETYNQTPTPSMTHGPISSQLTRLRLTSP